MSYDHECYEMYLEYISFINCYAIHIYIYICRYSLLANSNLLK
jgi:hypothetical protein